MLDFAKSNYLSLSFHSWLSVLVSLCLRPLHARLPLLVLPRHDFTNLSKGNIWAYFGVILRNVFCVTCCMWCYSFVKEQIRNWNCSRCFINKLFYMKMPLISSISSFWAFYPWRSLNKRKLWKTQLFPTVSSFPFPLSHTFSFSLAPFAPPPFPHILSISLLPVSPLLLSRFPPPLSLLIYLVMCPSILIETKWWKENLIS